MRALKFLLAGALVLEGLAPLPAMAQPRDREAVDACAAAISGEVRARFADARDVRVYDRDIVPGGDRGEVLVKGDGDFDGRDGRLSTYRFGCTFNHRTGATYALDVRDVRLVDNTDRKDKDKSAAVAGAVIGAAILGAAIAASKDKDHHKGDWFSPADGVRCYRKERACYRDGRYSDHWTRRVF